MNYVTLIICCSKVQNQPLHGKSKSIVQRAIKLQLVRFPKKPWQLQIIQLMGHTHHNSCKPNFPTRNVYSRIGKTKSIHKRRLGTTKFLFMEINKFAHK